MARLGALAELDFDHLDLGLASLGLKALFVKKALGRTAAEIAAGHLPDNVAAMAPVIGADGALAGIVGETAHPGAEVEGHDGIGAHRAEARPGDVQDRGLIGLATVRTADCHAEVGVLDDLRADGVRDPAIAHGAEIKDRAERLSVPRVLGPAINQGAVIPAEGQRIALILDDILAQLRPDRLQHETDMADDGVVPQDRV